MGQLLLLLKICVVVISVHVYIFSDGSYLTCDTVKCFFSSFINSGVGLFWG